MYLMGGALNGVWRFDSTGAAAPAESQVGAVFVANGSGGLVNPKDIAFGERGSLLAIGTGRNAVLKYDRVTGQPLTPLVADNAEGIANLEAMVFSPDRDLYLVGGALNGVWRFNGRTGAAKPGPLKSGAVFVESEPQGLSNIKDLCFDADGDLYLIGQSLNAVLKYDGTNGAFLGQFVPNGSGNIANLEALTFGPDGNLFVVGGGLNGVWRFRGDTGAPLPAVGKPDAVFVETNLQGLSNIKDLCFGPDGNLYLIGESRNAVLRYDGATGAYLGAFVGDNAAGIANLEAVLFPQALLPLPAVDPRGVAALMLLLAGATVVLLRRRPNA
jgi:streptogramin lyase